MRITWLPTEEYVSGRWYKEPGFCTSSREKVIQNNHIVGTEAKIARSKQHGHWLLEDAGTCAEQLPVLACPTHF